MFNDKDYSTLTLEELISEEKTTKRVQTLFLVILVALICSVFYGIMKEGLESTNMFVPLFFSLLVYKNSKTLKAIRAEIQNRTVK